MREKLTINELKSILEVIIEGQMYGEIDTVPYLQGPPGMGKTAKIKQIAKEKGWNVVSFNMGNIPYEAVSGIPDLREEEGHPIGTASGLDRVKVTDWTVPMLLDFKGIDPEKPTLFLLDDWHLASQQVQKLAFELFTDKKLQHYSLPEKTAIVLLGNDTKKAGIQPSISAVINRMSIYKVKPDVHAWTTEYAVPNEIHPIMISFVNQYNQHITEQESTSEPFGTLRSLTEAAKIIKKLEERTGKALPPNVVHNIISAHASEAAATNFIQMYIVSAKFNPEKLLKTGDMEAMPLEEGNELDRIVATDLLVLKLAELIKIESQKKTSEAKKNINKYIENFLDYNESKMANQFHLINALKRIKDISLQMDSGRNSIGKLIYAKILPDKTKYKKLNESLNKLMNI